MPPGAAERQPSRAQALLVEGGRRVIELFRRETKKRISDYQRATNWTRWRIWVVVGYALIAIPSLYALLPPRNSIDAYVRIKRVDLHALVGSQEPFFVFLRNDSQDAWHHLTVTLNRKYVYEKEQLGAGDAISIELDRFLKKGMPPTSPKARPPANVNAEKLVVSCDEGTAELDHPVEER